LNPAEPMNDDRVMSDWLIVAGWDGSPQSEVAVRAAGQHALRAHGQVRVVLVWDCLGQPHDFDPTFNQARAALLVHEAAHRLIPSDVPISAVEVLGRAHQEILEQAKDARMIVIGRSGLGNALARLMGSTSTAIVRAAKIPVLVVPMDCDE
jgi:nucleotide-binding universal stress UspA family protein